MRIVHRVEGEDFHILVRHDAPWGRYCVSLVFHGPDHPANRYREVRTLVDALDVAHGWHAELCGRADVDA